jgi:hypothetical protein
MSQFGTQRADDDWRFYGSQSGDVSNRLVETFTQISHWQKRTPIFREGSWRTHQMQRIGHPAYGVQIFQETEGACEDNVGQLSDAVNFEEGHTPL